MKTKFCPKCGKQLLEYTTECANCGCQFDKRIWDESSRSWLASLLLCLFLGGLGAHRFYTGYIGIGIIQLLTAGGFGLWWLIDLIFIITGSFKDIDGKELSKN